MTTPNDNSPWRCPECGELVKACACGEHARTDDELDDAVWQDRFIEHDFNDPHDYDEDYEDWGREP